MKCEPTNAGSGNDSESTENKVMIPSDKVSLLQESVDKMALSMFNALRLLPQTLGGDGHEDSVEAVCILHC